MARRNNMTGALIPVTKMIQFMFIFFLLTGMVIPLQTFPKKKISPEYVVDHHNLINGNYNETIHSITQTADGLIWLATEHGGVVKYDGLEFRNADLGEWQVKKNTTVYSDQSNILWVGRIPGVIQYSVSDQDSKFIEFNKKIGLSEILSFKEDSYGNLWCGTFGDSLKLLKNGVVHPYLQPGETNKVPYIKALLVDSYSNLWVGGRSQDGLFSVNNGRFIKKKFKTFITPVTVNALGEDLNRAILVGTSRGLLILKSDESEQLITVNEGLTANNINCLLTDKEGDIWVGTPLGLSRVSLNKDGEARVENVISNESILCLFEDRESNIWIGTEGAGLKRIRISSLKIHYSEAGLPNRDLLTYRDSRGRVWVGSQTGTLFQFKDNNFRPFLSIGDSSDYGITAIGEIDQNTLILGTRHSGLFVQQPDGFFRIPNSDRSFPEGVNFFFSDSSKKLWIGSKHGLYTYENGILELFNLPYGPRLFSIHDIFEKGKGELWLATSAGVLKILNGEVDRTLYLKDLPILKIFKDSQQVIWIGTQTSGLACLTRGNIHYINKTRGLFSNKIHGIYEDSLGHLWLSGDYGIQRVSLKSLNDSIQAVTSQISGIKFGVPDGMLSDKCIQASRNGILDFKNGDIWFSTNKGIVELNTKQIRLNLLPPGVIIDRIRVNQLTLKKTKNSPIFWGKSDLMFRISIPTFLSHENIQIKYKLEGADRNWKDHNKINKPQIYYPNLKPGQYQFRVKAANSHGVWNDRGDQFDFTVKYKIFNTILFRVSLALFISVLIGLILFFYKKYKKVQKLNQKYRTSPLEEDEILKITDKLIAKLEKEKVYLQPTISLNVLAKSLYTTTHKLSQIINSNMNMGFWELINHYRITEAKKMLRQQNKNHSITQIALSVGFNSNASFNRAFKKITDMSPSQYKKSLANT